MSPSKLGVFASLALAAGAVLIPPTMTADDIGNDQALEMLAIDPFKRSIALECPGCPFATQEDKSIAWTDGVGNAFLLDFEIGGQQDTLDISGFQLYPPTLKAAISSCYVTQIDPKSEESVRLRVTSFQSRFNAAETVSEEGTELLPITFQITSLEGVSVNPPEVKINMLKDTQGRLMIASFESTQAQDNTPTTDKEECNEWPLLCKWKGIVAERIEKMKKPGKGCHKRPHGHGQGNPMEHEGHHGKPPHRFRPGRPHHHHHHGHHGGHRHHRVHMFLRRALFTILIPIVIGIFAGTVTYLIGMAVGCLIAMVIAKVRGQQYQPIALDEDDIEQPQIVAESKEDFAELPAYDEPPVYEEAEEKQVDESK